MIWNDLHDLERGMERERNAFQFLKMWNGTEPVPKIDVWNGTERVPLKVERFTSLDYIVPNAIFHGI